MCCSYSMRQSLRNHPRSSRERRTPCKPRETHWLYWFLELRAQESPTAASNLSLSPKESLFSLCNFIGKHSNHVFFLRSQIRMSIGFFLLALQQLNNSWMVIIWAVLVWSVSYLPSRISQQKCHHDIHWAFRNVFVCTFLQISGDWSWERVGESVIIFLEGNSCSVNCAGKIIQLIPNFDRHNQSLKLFY